MSFAWAVIILPALVATGFVLSRFAARHRPRYLESAAWKDAHWRERHEHADKFREQTTDGR